MSQLWKENLPKPQYPYIPGLRKVTKKAVMRREKFVVKIDAVVPWTRILALIAPHCAKAGPKADAQRCPMRPGCSASIFFPELGSEAMSRFGGIVLNDDRIPIKTLSLTFSICSVATFNSDFLSGKDSIGLIGLLLLCVKFFGKVIGDV